MLDNITLILNRPSQKLIDNLVYSKLFDLSMSVKITDTIANHILNHPDVGWEILHLLAGNPSISEEFHKNYTIKHSEVNWPILNMLAMNPLISEEFHKNYTLKHQEMDVDILISLVQNPSISEEFHEKYTLKHSKYSWLVLQSLETFFPHTNWKKLCSTTQL